MAQALAFLNRTRDGAIEGEIQRLQAQQHAVRTRMKEREPLLTLEEAIAECQRKVERLANGQLTSTEAAAAAAAYDIGIAKRLVAQAKDELRELIARRPEVAKARQEQAADEAELAAIRAKMQAVSARTLDPVEGMNWID